MVFRMSYGAPPAPPAKPAPEKPAAKKAAPRVRKGGSLKDKAQALFDPAHAATKAEPDAD